MLAEEALRRHTLWVIRSKKRRKLPVLPNPGEFHWRAEGERHMWDPKSIADIQVAARAITKRNAYKRFADHINKDAQTRCQLRGLLQVQAQYSNGGPIPLDEVQPSEGNR